MLGIDNNISHPLFGIVTCGVDDDDDDDDDDKYSRSYNVACFHMFDCRNQSSASLASTANINIRPARVFLADTNNMNISRCSRFRQPHIPCSHPFYRHDIQILAASMQPMLIVGPAYGSGNVQVGYIDCVLT